MNPPTSELPWDALASTGAATWIWDSELPDVLEVRWPYHETAKNLREIVNDEEWHLLTSCLQQALLDEQTFLTRVAVDSDDDDRCELELLGARSIRAAPLARVTGLCWLTSDGLRRDVQPRWAPLAKLSHELRSPLAAVMQQARGLGNRVDDSAICEGLDSIRDSSIYMLRIIDDMLAAFRAGEPESVREPESLSIDRLAGQIVPIAADRAGRKGLQLRVHKQADFPERFWAEPVALRRILQNLLDNAIKYTSQGEINLALGVTETDDGAVLCFDVEDTGLGMSADEIARVFEPFSKGRAGQRGAAGLGIGLAVSQQLASGLGGELAVNSELGKGSCFRLTIPARVSDDDLAAEAPAVEEYDMTVVSPGKKVLLVDDHQLLCTLTGRELSKLGCEVETVASARGAIAKIDEWIPDLVILDLDLPDMSGCELCRQLIDREELAHCRFVAYSGSDAAADRQAAESAGFHAFYVKPAGAEELLGI